MKIKFSPYQLKGIPPFKSREGVLLRVETEEGSVGYSDVHPWSELGDKPLNEQLSLLKMGAKTPLTKRSLYFAEKDANARASGKHLIEHLEIPPSHWLLKSPEDVIPEDFTTVKIKAGPSDDLKSMMSSLPGHVKIRIDFNNKHTFDSFSKFIQTIPEFWERIDFIEDPFIYNKKKWESMPVPLAGDFQEKRGPIAIVKPAVDDFEGFLSCDRIIVTSYLDHPIGQLGAAYTAGHLKKREVCGLLSHLVYEKNAFSERLKNNGPNLIVPKEGTGFGFDDLLENLSWTPL